mmetsp:Transcript_5759/g.35791  ORF Transcript_5759/g.35791 Transcript_5759/m.35791 type:complete len:235 (+) Transcript_5759:4253-4957(+)
MARCIPIAGRAGSRESPLAFGFPSTSLTNAPRLQGRFHPAASNSCIDEAVRVQRPIRRTSRPRRAATVRRCSPPLRHRMSSTSRFPGTVQCQWRGSLSGTSDREPRRASCERLLALRGLALRSPIVLPNARSAGGSPSSRVVSWQLPRLLDGSPRAPSPLDWMRTIPSVRSSRASSRRRPSTSASSPWLPRRRSRERHRRGSASPLRPAAGERRLLRLGRWRRSCPPILWSKRR